LIRDFPEFYKIYSLQEFKYNNITQPNRNRLLFIDPSVDGFKTGHTNSAGYCLIASAKREKRRLLSVVLGAKSDVARAMESQKLLNFGFQFYETVKLYPATGKRIQAQMISQQPLLAPIKRGQQLGTLRLTVDGQAAGDYPLLALETIPVAGILGRGWDNILLMFK
jgi:D-alanyl-D-alanine carboxypeptidase (penicillin-binding protein 5/6)